MKFYGQTMRSFSKKKLKNGKYLLSAPTYYKRKYMGHVKYEYDPEANVIEYVGSEQ